MEKTNRRKILRIGAASFAVPLLPFMEVGCAADDNKSTDSDSTNNTEKTETEPMMKIQYLEVVSPDVDAICKTYEKLYGVEFGEPDAFLGNARTADLPDGGLLGVRAPLREDEKPVVRPYFLVKDIEASVAKLADSGAEIAVPPMELPGHGKCAIFLQGGADHGLWQLASKPE